MRVPTEEAVIIFQIPEEAVPLLEVGDIDGPLVKVKGEVIKIV
jgi:hypothetical protein